MPQTKWFNNNFYEIVHVAIDLKRFNNNFYEIVHVHVAIDLKVIKQGVDEHMVWVII